MNNSSNEGLFYQAGVLTSRYTRTIIHNKKKLLMIVLFPLALALVIVWVAGEGMFETFEQTQSCLFMMVSATIFVGLCNTIQEVCKERNIVKREYMANLNLGSYIISKLVVQGFASVISTAIAMTVYYMSFEFPEESVVTGNSAVDFFISLLLLMLSSNAMGLMISSIVKSNDAANTIAPYLLIVQVVFSGVLFEMEGAMDIIADAMLSKWGMAELGSACDINNLPSRYMRPIDPKDIYEGTLEHMLIIWGILLGILVFCAVVSMIVLRRVSKDVR